jgi:sRNA-binding regulator protein Hfq
VSTRSRVWRDPEDPDEARTAHPGSSHLQSTSSAPVAHAAQSPLGEGRRAPSQGSAPVSSKAETTRPDSPRPGARTGSSQASYRSTDHPARDRSRETIDPRRSAHRQPPAQALQRSPSRPQPQAPSKASRRPAQSAPPRLRPDNPNESLHKQAQSFALQLQIPEAIAFQIVRGDFTLKQWLDKHAQAEVKRQERDKLDAVKRQRRSREEGMAQQYFLKQKKKGIPLGFALADHTYLEGLIVSILPYHFWIEWLDHQRQPQRTKLEKLQVLYCYKVENRDDLPELLRVNEPVRQQQRTPSRDRKERYTPSARLLDLAVNSDRVLRVSLIDGTTFAGTVDWYSSHFVKLKLADQVSVVVFNHALEGLTNDTPPGTR